jgi:AmmeMemoRadiSam system protein B
MLVFACFCPHPPLAIPSIGKENFKLLTASVNGMKKLGQKLVSSQPEIIIVISPHSTTKSKDPISSTAANFKGNFINFGDLSVKIERRGCPEIAEEVSRLTEKKIFFTNESEGTLDYGMSIPLFYLTENAGGIPILPITTADATNKKCFLIGKHLQKIFKKMNKRVAVVASGDLSHRLLENAPGGFSEKAKEFDYKVIDNLKNKNYEGIVNIDKKLQKEALTCGLASMAMIGGIMEKTPHEPQILSYEFPFGVGYLTVDMMSLKMN